MSTSRRPRCTARRPGRRGVFQPGSARCRRRNANALDLKIVEANGNSLGRGDHPTVAAQHGDADLYQLFRTLLPDPASAFAGGRALADMRVNAGLLTREAFSDFGKSSRSSWSLMRLRSTIALVLPPVATALFYASEREDRGGERLKNRASLRATPPASS